jgi:hypothetical protein
MGMLFALISIGAMTPRNYGALRSSSTVKVGENVCEEACLGCDCDCGGHGDQYRVSISLHRKYFVAEEQRVIVQAANASTTGGASHMEFRGLHAGLTRAEVETLLRKLDENSALECDKPENGLYSCHSSGISADPDMASVGFSSEDRLV